MTIEIPSGPVGALTPNGTAVDAQSQEALNLGYRDFLNQPGSVPTRPNVAVPVSNVPLKPAGYKILVKMYRSAEKTKSGIFIPQTTQADESVASLLCEVIELGPLCYKDPDKYFTGPWCKTGDIIIMKSYAGVRLQVGDDEYRLINDDSVDAVVTDVSQLSDIKRAY